MSTIEKIKEQWRKLKYIRPAFWWLYKRRPTAVFRRKRNNYWLEKKLPRMYLEAAKEPVDERRVLFVEPRYAQMRSSMTLLYELMKKDPRFDVTFFAINNIDKTRYQSFLDSEGMVAFAARAKYIFSTDVSAILGCMPMRRETVYVQLWHACGAFKKFGMSTSELEFGSSRENQLKHPGYANTDIVTVSSSEICWAYAQAMNLPESCIYPIGVSRTDVFFREENRKASYEKLWKLFPASKGKKVILFAPTFRGHIKTAVTSEKFRPEIFAKALSDEYVLVTKHHPMVKELPVIPADIRGSFAWDATGSEIDVEELMMAADICITDYSSIVFEFALMQRPMLFFAYDLEEYYDWRGFYYPYEEMTPGPICRTNEEMVDYILHLDERYEPERITAFRERFMGACDGHSTERILETALKLGKEKS